MFYRNVDRAITELAAFGTLDWLTIVAGAAYAVLAIKRVRWCWLAGALSSAVLVYISYRAALPMQAALQFFYVAMAAYGFWRWSKAGDDSTMRINRWPLSANAGAIAALCGLGWLLGPSLAPWTHAAWPRLDAVVMLGSLLATWMTTQARLENWYYWIVIDVASIYLYYMQNAPGAALLYVIYTAIALAGAWTWTRLYRAQRPCRSPS